MSNSEKRPFYKRPLVLAAVLAIPLVSVACAGGNHHKRHGDMEKMSEHMIERMTKKLDLNETQQKELQDIQAYVKENRPSHPFGEENPKKALAELLTAESFDRAAFDQKWNEMSETYKAGAAKREVFIDGLSAEVGDFLASLDGEQREQIAERLEKFEKRGGHKWRNKH